MTSGIIQRAIQEAESSSYKVKILEVIMTSGIIQRAIQEAESSSYKVKIGCVIFKGNRIISSGHNAIRSSRIHPKYRLFNNSLHAEQSAILKIDDWSNLKGCSILVVKVSKCLGILSMAKPCEMCQTLLDYIGIKNIWYSNKQGEIIRDI